MKITTPEGFYVLGVTITNPRPDKRRKNVVSAQTEWDTGSRWRVRHFDHLPSRLETDRGAIFEDSEQVLAILPHLTPAEPALGQFVDRMAGYSAEVILARAIESGALTLGQVRQLTAVEISDDEGDALLRRNWLR